MMKQEISLAKLAGASNASLNQSSRETWRGFSKGGIWPDLWFTRSG